MECRRNADQNPVTWQTVASVKLHAAHGRDERERVPGLESVDDETVPECHEGGVGRAFPLATRTGHFAMATFG